MSIAPVEGYHMHIDLNGYWDILPLLKERPGMPDGPSVGNGVFIKNTYRVPSLFCYLHKQDDKGLFNAFDYPAEWRTTRDAWIRREVQLGEDVKGKKVFLHFGAIAGHSKIWINGRVAGENIDPTMPVDLDITSQVRFDKANEILVRVADSPRTPDGRPLVPDGGVATKHGAGIWQDVYLDVREPVYVKDYTYTTSFQDKRVRFQIHVANESGHAVDAVVRLELKGALAERAKAALPADRTTTVSFDLDAAGLNFWSAEHPHLYDLVLDVEDGEARGLDRVERRIGFREIRIDGPHFLVNGKVTHFYGDWGHRVHPYQQRPEYIRCWYRMLKDLGMNYVRMHTGPHDPVVYEIANEMGIYVCGETALHGSFGDLATGAPEFWDNAADHVRRFVKRDRNEACLVLWSAGNEMRWNAPIDRTLREYPKIAAIMRELDPTRPVYFEGDSSLWDESAQEIISRHYGLEIAGEGWWDKSRPLHVGEMGKWHYGQPPENVMLGGNRAYESLWESHYAAGVEAALIIERARNNDVASLFPWNMTCLDNPPGPDHDVTLTWETPEGRFPKPTRVPAFSSEFVWWQPAEPPYRKGSSFDLLREAFRPETVFVWERQSEYFVDAPIHRTVTVINDTEDEHEYELVLRVDGKETIRKIKVGPGGRHHVEHKFTVGREPATIVFAAVLKRDGNVLVAKTQRIRVEARAPETAKRIAGNPIKILGDGSLTAYFAQRGITPVRISNMEGLGPRDILVIEKNAASSEQAFTDALISFVDGGGRVLLMEQVVSIFKDMGLTKLNVIQAHPQTRRVSDLDFAWWGEKAILGSGGKDFVVALGYDKPVAGDFCSWVDAGTGDFGGGGLRQSALLEMRWGRGVMMANALELTACWDKVPSAARVLDRVLSYLAEYEPAAKAGVWLSPSLKENSLLSDLVARPTGTDEATVLVLDGARPESLDIDGLPAGSVVLIAGVTPDTKAHYERVTGIRFDLIPVSNECQGVLDARTDLTEGISNEELFWLNRLMYTPRENRNYQISNGYALTSDDLEPIVSLTRDRTLIEFTENWQSSELFRAKMFPLFGNTNRRGILLGGKRVRGRRILFCQIRLPFAEEKRSSRFWSMLLANLGAARPQVFLGRGPGQGSCPPFPRQLHVLKDYTPEHYEKLLHFRRNLERMNTSPELSVGTWEELKSADGRFTLPAANRLIVLSYVSSPRARKLIQTVGGLPNPAHTTSLELAGRGEVELIIGQRVVFRGTVTEGQPRVIPELELEDGLNTVLVVFRTIEGPLFSMRWKTAARSDEYELVFN